MNVLPATPEQRRNALHLLFSQQPSAVRECSIDEALDAELAGEFSLDGLLVFADGDAILGSVLYVIQPDKTAFIWPPMTDECVDDPPSLKAALLTELTARIRADQAWIGQCIIEPHETESRQTLTRNGYPLVTELDFLHLDLTDESLTPRRLKQLAKSVAQQNLDTAEFSAETYGRFAHVIELTYVDTLDCPLLSERRSVDEAISSHQTSGKFDPSRWKVYSADGEDVGVLLLSDYPEQQAWEVVYMGVVPAARGYGYGRAILEAGICDAIEQRTTGLFLAVDTQNRVAHDIYGAANFKPVATRVVHAKFL